MRTATRVEGRERASGWTTGRFLGFLALILLAAYPDVLIGGRTFFFRDFGFFGYPLASHWRESVLAGEWPLWNPLSNCGLPFLAQWNTMTLYPPMLFCLVLPLWWALPVLNLAHLLWGGMGMRALAAERLGGQWGPVLAGVTFAFGGLMLNCLMWPNNVAALAWMPWILRAAPRACLQGGRQFLVAALCGGMQMLAGGVEIILLTWLLAGVLCSAVLVRRVGARWRIATRWGLLVAAVAGLAAAQLAPFLQLLAHSQRSTNFGDGSWSMPLAGWANLFVPLFDATPVYHGVYFLTGQAWTSSYYVGIGTVALAFLAMWRVRNNEAWLWGAVGVAGLILASGDNGGVYSWLRTWFPAMGWMRFPIKFIVLVAVALPLLAAVGMSWLESLDPEGRRREARRFAWIALGVGLTVAGILLWGKTRGEAPRGFVLNGITRLAFVAASAGVVWFGWASRPHRWQGLTRAALPVIAALDLISHMPRQNPAADPLIYSSQAVQGFLPNNPSPEVGVSRVMLSADAGRELRFSWLEDAEDQYISRRVAMFSNCNLVDGLAKVDGFYSLYPAAHAALLDRLNAEDSYQLGGLADFMAISHVTQNGTLFDWEPRPTFQPMVLGGQGPIFAAESVALERMFEGEFDPARIVYLPEEARVEAAEGGSIEVRVTEFSARRVAFSTRADGPRWLTVAQNWYPCWEARVDGERVRLWRANHAFQAVAVPEGEHQVEIVYEDRAFRWGGFVSAASLVGCGLGWRRAGRKGRDFSRPPHPTDGKNCLG